MLKLEDGEIMEPSGTANSVENDGAMEETDAVNQSDRKPSNLNQSGWSRRDGHEKGPNVVTLYIFLSHMISLFFFHF